MDSILNEYVIAPDTNGNCEGCDLIDCFGVDEELKNKLNEKFGSCYLNEHIYVMKDNNGCTRKK